MSRVYLLTESDFENLLLRIAQDPRPRIPAENPHSSEHRDLIEQAHRFYNYEIRTWLTGVKADR